MPWSVAQRAFEALQLALGDFAMLGMGLFGLMGAMWLAIAVARQGRGFLTRNA